MTRKYPIQIWYFMTLVFTGALLLPHLIWPDAGNYSISFTQFGPLFATLLLLRLTRDDVAARTIKNGLRFHSCNVLWYILSALIPIVLTGISALVLNTLPKNEYHAWNGTPLLYVLNIAAMFLGSIGEELGWRGYLLPMLSKKYTPLAGSVLVGLLWGGWHLNYAGDMAFWLLFIVTTIELSIILTFLLHRTKGNIWAAIIFHTVFNLANRVFVWERFNTELLLIEIVLFGLACVVVLALDRKAMFAKDV